MDEVPHIEKHLLECARCVAAIAAGVASRGLSSRSSTRVQSVVIIRMESTRRRVLHGLAVGLSLLALGGSVAWWYLDPGMPPNDRSPWLESPSDVTRGAIESVD
ncbi:MAG TPA: hypothetical protein VMG12_38710 [Polyangiaceae bacterium]|nr:hypothetical protein [Polyangiaceae bacterium]